MAGSLDVYHLHMGGPDNAALEWRALYAPRFAPRLKNMGVTFTESAAEADVVVVTGLLTQRNVDAVLGELESSPAPSVLMAAGDAAINGGAWAKADMPALSPYALSHYADVRISVPGDPPTPQALIAGLVAAAELLSHPVEKLASWEE